MAEKTNKPLANMWVKPVPMKLFAAWEVDRTSSNCIPRYKNNNCLMAIIPGQQGLCTLTITRLVLLKPLSGEVSSIIIAVKMQSSKRTLRSNEIMIPSNGLLDTELDLTFSLQYPHFLKRNGNILQVMIQRRKKYKNRAILGFKTLAGGVINMAQVLQKPMDKELDLSSNIKDKSEILAKVTMLALSSQPVDHYEVYRRKLISERVVEADNFSDEEEEYSSNEEGCDSEPVPECPNGAHLPSRRSQFRKRNIKQKFIALLKKFKIPDTEVSDSEQYPEELERELIGQNPREIEELIEELEDLTDSAPEVDDISISSTPKPSLRPFFSSGTLTLSDRIKACGDKLSDDSTKKDSESHQESGTDQEQTDTNNQSAGSPPRSASGEEKKSLVHTFSGPEKDKKKPLFTRDKNVNNSKEKRSPSIKENKEKSGDKNNSKESESSPKKAVLEQLTKIFSPPPQSTIGASNEEWVPDHLVLASGDGPGTALARQLQDRGMAVVAPANAAPDLRAALSCLLSRIQKFCNCNSRAPPTIKIALIGQESFVNGVLRLYVEHFSSKPPEWQAYVRFYIIPYGAPSPLVKYLARIDSSYGALFVDGSWRELLDRGQESLDSLENAASRVLNYLNGANSLLQLPIAEAMVTYRSKSADEESNQVFIPFISDVKVGTWDTSSTTSVDFDEQLTSNLIVPSSSPPSAVLATSDKISPPSSPSLPQPVISGGESLELQIDYWSSMATKADKKADSTKSTLKTAFRSLQVSRLPSPMEISTNALIFNYITKEKKQKIMRLGKKREKEVESRYQTAEGISRLICSCKNPPLKVLIDGVEWSGVKFFQLTPQWQTHVKYFPISVFSDQMV